MKLYATVTSERATKGQGGNKYLDIDIFVGSKDNSRTLARLTVRPNENGYTLYDHTDKKLFEITESELRGNNQKGECPHQPKKWLERGGICTICSK